MPDTNIKTEIDRILQYRDLSFDAVEAKGVTVPSGSTIDDLPDLIMAIQSGSGSAISIVDTTDANGGTIRTITGVSLAGDTVTAATLLNGVTAHNSLGEAITGSYVPPTGAVIEANKTVSPTESQQIVTPSTGYDALAQVTVSAISSTYVGTGITRRSSSNLTASEDTVTVPAGYYENQASKSVSTMVLPTSASASAATGYTSKATISRSTSDQYINIPTGYNTAGAYYKVNAVPNGAVTAPSSISGSSATVSTGTNTLTLTKTISVTPNVTAAGFISSGTAGNSSVSLTASVTTKGAATITPTKSTQTIASGTYLTGTQTIAAIPVAYQDVTGVTAAAGDVVTGKTIVDSTGATVNGSLVINKYYTGSSTPSSSLGNNGDLYLKV